MRTRRAALNTLGLLFKFTKWQIEMEKALMSLSACVDARARKSGMVSMHVGESKRFEKFMVHVSFHYAQHFAAWLRFHGQRTVIYAIRVARDFCSIFF